MSHYATPQLNKEQQEAVHHIDGPLLVIAGAGSGKTRIVTYRIAHLLDQGIPADRILAMTFTNKAADEMRHRIFHLTHQSVLTCTFHSLCAKILREAIPALGYSRTFVIYDEEDTEKVLRECFSLLDCKPDKGDVRAVRAAISKAKNALEEPDEVHDVEIENFHTLYSFYQRRLKECNALDFDDLLFLTVKLFRTHPDILADYQKRWQFLLIDEYQDTNAAQYTLTNLLVAAHQNVFAVGDPDQSIYSWRGANISNILNFERDFPGAKVIALEQNYRSRNNILKAANALIAHNTSRYEKNLWTDRGEGAKITLFVGADEHQEARFVVQQLYKLHQEQGISLNECVIFYRTNFQSRLFEDYLLRERLPYVIVGGLSFYQRKEIKDMLGLLRVVLSGTDVVAFWRTINLPKRGLGETTLVKLRDFALSTGSNLFDICESIVEKRVTFKLSQKQFEGLSDYVHVITTLREMVRQDRPLSELLIEAIERSRYMQYLREDPDSHDERRQNVEELVSKAAEWEQDNPNPTLSNFLEELTLKSSADEKAAPEDQIRMMTLHNGKGLEFQAAFVVGLEEELLPHANSLEDPQAIEEERRLCYVGMTRAKEFLFLSASRYRFLWGMPRFMRASRFLKEIPEEFIQKQFG